MSVHAPQSYLNLSVTIERRTGTVSGSGYPDGSFSTLASNVAAGFVELSGDEAVRFQRLDNRYTGKFLFDPGQSINEKDRVVWGSRSFEVLSVIVRRYASGFQSHAEAICAETKGGNN